MKIDRPTQRRPDGNIVSMMKDENRYELVQSAIKSRSGGQWDIWEATYWPVGADGYPQRDLGQVHRQDRQGRRRVLERDYDLRHILESRLGHARPEVANKLNVYVGDATATT